MFDDWQLYCDTCANMVVVSFYDPMVNLLQQDKAGQGGSRHDDLAGKIEQRLRPCSCGGRYRFDAPRRCYRCLAEVITDEPAVNLFPAIYGIDVDERHPTAEEIAWVDEFEARFIRRDNLWM